MNSLIPLQPPVPVVEGPIARATKDVITCLAHRIIVPSEEYLIDHLSAQDTLKKFCMGEDYIEKIEFEELPSDVTLDLYNLKIERMLNQCHTRANDLMLNGIYTTWGSLISFARTSYRNYTCVVEIVHNNNVINKEARKARKEVRKLKRTNASLNRAAVKIENKIIIEMEKIENSKPK